MQNEIALSVTRDVRRSPQPGHTRAGSGADDLRDRVIRQGRFGRRCYFCHLPFGDSGEFEVHHLDHDHANESADNAVPICSLCHMPFHLDLVLREMPNEPGRIIYAPELSQQRLSSLLYAIGAHSTRVDPTNRSEHVAGQIYESLLRRADAVERVDGREVRPKLSQVHAMVRLLQDVSAERYGERADWLSGCLYLPPLSMLMQQAEHWRAAGFATLDLSSWDDIAGPEA
ncbi:HNH endonuclease [Xanthomonas arboricola]|uniref:Intracellular multiplication protein IcmJ n=1 Tax=Xanthomonas arboricola TaxID=56448 RepID=A0AB73H332_9XANT|nr:HNH endonuclease [Xanthomonas arboricola]MBB5672593.1 intracellular multiplication protein IcmJ [Xanthomonas arboricola]